MSNYKGFSLIELMVTIAIVAVLSAVALPAYKNYIIRAELAKVHAALVPIFHAKILEYYNKNGSMPDAGDLQVNPSGGQSYEVDLAKYGAAGGSYVSYIELSRRVQNQSLCPVSSGCTDMVIGWNSTLGVGGANLMWVRFYEQNGTMKMQCGLHENVPGIYRSLYPPNCQGISPGYTTFSVS